ncbi:MAG: hypothetical protein LUM44_12255 [Pyrinomonadaceae bacterium]|nr:hypothetical protein [Pyrinomonadaceae bacterium]
MSNQQTPKQKIESVIQILDAIRGGQIAAENAIENLTKISAIELNSDIGRFASDAIAIAQSYGLRPVSERQTPVLDNALFGLKTRAKPFLKNDE